MKKKLSLIFIFACLALVLALPAFAHGTDNNDRDMNPLNNNMNMRDLGTNNARTFGDTLGTNGTTTGTYNNTRTGAGRVGAYGTNGINNGVTGNGGTYRARAAANDNDFDWGWVGLLGLIGLFGLRSRNHERT